MKLFTKSKILLFGIILLGAFFRLYNLNWDHSFHLNPDERFLTMVGTAMKMPSSITQYFSPQQSLLNPANIDFKFYVYGTLPVVMNKLFALVISSDAYDGFELSGRVLSALADLLTLVFVIKLLQLFQRQYHFPKKIIYLGGFFYAISVLPIQLSHFFTVDTFVTCFAFISVYFISRYYYERDLLSLLSSAIFFALALGAKVSAIYTLPIHFVVLFIVGIHHPPVFTGKLAGIVRKISRHQKYLQHSAVLLLTYLIFALVTYIVLRIADPYYFADQNIFHVQPNQLFVQNMLSLSAQSNGSVIFPPAVQWVHKLPVIFALYNIAIFGVGLPYFLFSILGMILIIRKRPDVLVLVLLGWFLLFFFYQSIQFTKVMRYFFILYPFLAIFAGIGFYALVHKWKRSWQIACLVVVLIWPLSFLSIYIQPMTRVSASYWIFKNIPAGSYLLNESWDDPLPLLVAPNQYGGEMLPVFDPDSPEKWQKMDTALQKGDYYILSSNRGWGSIPTVPERYPQMKQFYSDLFAGKTQYKLIKEFSSYPSLTYLGIPFTFPDQWSDESFTVYDHPKVMIFRNTAKQR